MKINPIAPGRAGGDFPRIEEILNDAEDSHRLNDWEIEFCDSLRGAAETYGADMIVSERQWQVIDRIERKLYG